MTILRSMITNVAARSIAELINRFSSAVFWILIARRFGAAGLGSLAFGISLFALFETIATLGLSSVVIRDVARRRGRAGQYFGHTLLLGFISTLAFMVLMIAAAHWIKPSEDSQFAACVMAVALIPASGFYWSRAMLSAAERMSYIAIARTAENLFKVGAGVFVIFSGFGLRYVIVVVALSKIVSFLICFGYAFVKVARPDYRLKMDLAKYLLKQIPSFSMIAVFNALFWSVTVVVLTKLAGETEAGTFSAAFKLVDVGLSFALSYGQALFPISSRISSNNFKLFEHLCKKSIKYITLFTMAIAAGTSILSHRIILLVYGSGMTLAVPVLRVLIWILVPFAIIPVFAYSLVTHERQNQDLVANISAVLGVILLNIGLVPIYGAFGSALSLLFGCLVFFIVEYYWVQKGLYRFEISIRSVKPFLGVVLMSAAVFLLRESNLLLTVFVGGIIFLAFLGLSGSVTDFDLRLIKQLKSI